MNNLPWDEIENFSNIFNEIINLEKEFIRAPDNALAKALIKSLIIQILPTKLEIIEQLSIKTSELKNHSFYKWALAQKCVERAAYNINRYRVQRRILDKNIYAKYNILLLDPVSYLLGILSLALSYYKIVNTIGVDFFKTNQKKLDKIQIIAENLYKKLLANVIALSIPENFKTYLKFLAREATPTHFQKSFLPEINRDRATSAKKLYTFKLMDAYFNGYVIKKQTLFKGVIFELDELIEPYIGKTTLDAYFREYRA